jgi:hypothetical protein
MTLCPAQPQPRGVVGSMSVGISIEEPRLAGRLGELKSRCGTWDSVLQDRKLHRMGPVPNRHQLLSWALPEMLMPKSPCRIYKECGDMSLSQVREAASDRWDTGRHHQCLRSGLRHHLLRLRRSMEYCRSSHSQERSAALDEQPCMLWLLV